MESRISLPNNNNPLKSIRKLFWFQKFTEKLNKWMWEKAMKNFSFNNGFENGSKTLQWDASSIVHNHEQWKWAVGFAPATESLKGHFYFAHERHYACILCGRYFSVPFYVFINILILDFWWDFSEQASGKRERRTKINCFVATKNNSTGNKPIDVYYFIILYSTHFVSQFISS